MTSATNRPPEKHQQDNAVAGLRLLPWSTPDGKPCYLSTEQPDSLMSLVADDIETDQLCNATEVVAEAQAVLDDPAAGPLSLRLALQRTTASLGEVLRIAYSRGVRLVSATTTSHGTDHDEHDSGGDGKHSGKKDPGTSKPSSDTDKPKSEPKHKGK